MYVETEHSKGESILICIDTYLNENKLESSFLNDIELEQIESLIHLIRGHADYKTLFDWPIGHGDQISKGFKTLCENVLFDYGNPYKLCFRALTLYIFTVDLCHFRLKDNDVKKEIMKITKETIDFYNVDWTIILERRLMKWNIVKFMCTSVIMFGFALLVKNVFS